MVIQDKLFYPFFCRLFDILICIIGLLVCTPLFIIIALLIKLNCKGSIFYSRRVLGINGNHFTLYKFRTMINNAHDQLVNNPNLSKQYESNTKIPDDHRVTRIGHFLRKYSIDELPQLWNILQGHMTLVGPRVLGDIEYGWYGRYGTKILSVKPGLTGLAQVKNRGGGIHRRIACDLYYLKNRNILLYFYILIHTVYIVIIGTGK